MSKIWDWTSLIVGSLIGIIGIVLVGMYVVEAVLKRAGEADQSLAFWYLPILFMGIGGFVAGGVLAGWGIVRIRKRVR